MWLSFMKYKSKIKKEKFLCGNNSSFNMTIGLILIKTFFFASTNSAWFYRWKYNFTNQIIFMLIITFITTHIIHADLQIHITKFYTRLFYSNFIWKSRFFVTLSYRACISHSKAKIISQMVDISIFSSLTDMNEFLDHIIIGYAMPAISQTFHLGYKKLIDFY